MASLSALGFVLRVFAYLFELVLSFFLIGLGIVAWVSGSNSLSFGMQFWEGVTLKWIILIAGIVGLASLLLAGSRLRWIFPVWSFLVLMMRPAGSSCRATRSRARISSNSRSGSLRARCSLFWEVWACYGVECRGVDLYFSGSFFGANSEESRCAAVSWDPLSFFATRSRCSAHRSSPLAAQRLSHL